MLFNYHSMKNSIFALLSALLLTASLSAEAQTTKLPPRRKVEPRGRVVLKPGQEMFKDGAAMKGGKIIVTENGHITPLTADKTLINGTKITAAGLITAPGGATTQLQEGDHMSLSGRVTTRVALTEQDSLRKIMEYDTKMRTMTKLQKARLKTKEKTDKAKAKRMSKRDKPGQ